jgi:hypothetical protein
MLADYMHMYLDDSSIFYEEIRFDLATDSLIKAHRDTMQQLSNRIMYVCLTSYKVLTNLWCSARPQRIVIFITNHSHTDTGDLYVSSNLCAPVKDVSKV